MTLNTNVVVSLYNALTAGSMPTPEVIEAFKTSAEADTTFVNTMKRANAVPTVKALMGTTPVTIGDFFTANEQALADLGITSTQSLMYLFTHEMVDMLNKGVTEDGKYKTYALIG